MWPIDNTKPYKTKPRTTAIGRGIVLQKNISLHFALDFVNQHSQILPKEKFIILTFINLLGDDYKDQLNLSAQEISDATGYNRRSVQRYTSKLRIRNILEIENTYIGKGFYCGSNKYRVVGWPEWIENHE